MNIDNLQPWLRWKQINLRFPCFWYSRLDASNKKYEHCTPSQFAFISPWFVSASWSDIISSSESTLWHQSFQNLKADNSGSHISSNKCSFDHRSLLGAWFLFYLSELGEILGVFNSDKISRADQIADLYNCISEIAVVIGICMLNHFSTLQWTYQTYDARSSFSRFRDIRWL